MKYFVRDITQFWKNYEPKISDMEDIFGADAWNKDELREQFNASVNIIGAFDDDMNLVGYISTELKDRFEHYIWTFVVDPAVQGKGYGGILLKHLMNTTSNRNLSLHVRKENQSARALYEKAGFVVNGSDLNHYDDGGEAIIYRLDDYAGSGLK